MNVAFTIATKNYLPQAKALSDSYLYHHPRHKFIIYLVDKIDKKIDIKFSDQAEIIEVDTLEIENFHKMSKIYTLFEFLTAIKPILSILTIKRYPNLDAYIFLDSDMLVYSNMDNVNKILAEGFEIILSSHFFTPPPVDGFFPDEKTYFNCGTFNAGFFAFSNKPNSLLFLNWWNDRLKTECILNFSKGLFYEQIWLNLVPLYFKNVNIISHPGYNVGYWNFHERRLEKKSDNKFSINEVYDLVLFHFSGFDIKQQDVISKFQNRFRFEDKSEYKEIFNHYTETLLSNKYESMSHLQNYYSFAKPVAKPSIVQKIIIKIKALLKYN